MNNTNAASSLSSITSVETLNKLGEEKLIEPLCSFCGLKKSEVEHLYSGDKAYICGQCLTSGAKHISANLEFEDVDTAQELVKAVFSNWKTNELVSYQKVFKNIIASNIHSALNAAFALNAHYKSSIHTNQEFESIDLGEILHKEQESYCLRPLSICQDGRAEHVKLGLLKNALFVTYEKNLPILVLSNLCLDQNNLLQLSIEFTVPAGPVSESIIYKLFSRFETALRNAKSLDHNLIQISESDHLNGQAYISESIPQKAIGKESIVLPTSTRWAIEDGIIKFAKNREPIKILGYTTKRCVLIHGAAGSGKTYVAKYISQQLPQHNLFWFNADSINCIKQYFSMMRAHKSAVLIIDDIDIIVQRFMNGTENSSYSYKSIFYEIERLSEDEEYIIVLTANNISTIKQLDLLRPGFVDQFIELKNPEESERRQLINVYRHGLSIHRKLVDEIVRRTDQFNPVAIKELIRRLALLSIDDNNGVEVKAEHLDLAFADMIFNTKVYKNSVSDFLSTISFDDKRNSKNNKLSKSNKAPPN